MRVNAAVGFPALGLALGMGFVALGAFLPASAILAAMSPPAQVDRELLFSGAGLFRVGLVLLGAYAVSCALFVSRVVPRPRPDPASMPGSSSRWELLTIVAILVVASILRLYGLDQQPWWDEIWTWFDYVSIPVGETLLLYDDQNQHILYTLLAKASIVALGDGVVALRLPAAALGVASVAATYWLARRFLEAPGALLASALLAVSYHHVWFSQNARGYTALMTAALVSSLLFLRALERDRAIDWLAYALVCTAGVYAHVSMVCTVAAHFLLYCWETGSRPAIDRSVSAIAFGFVPATLLTFQLYSLVLPQIFALNTSSTSQLGDVETWSSPVWAILDAAASMTEALGSPWLLFTVVCLLVFGCVQLRRRPLALGLFLVPLAMCALLILVSGNYPRARFFFFAGGMAAIFVVAGAQGIGAWLGRWLDVPLWGHRMGSALCVMLILISAGRVSEAYRPKQDLLGAYAYVERLRAPGDRVVAIRSAGSAIKRITQNDWIATKRGEDLEPLLAMPGRTWLVYTFPVAFQHEYADLYSRIGRDFEQVAEFGGSLHGGEVVVCRSVDRVGSTEVSADE